MSNKKTTREDYLFLSAFLRAKEAKMLTADKAERMLSAQGFDEAAKMLVECGYEDFSGMNASELQKALSDRRDEIFCDLERMAPDKELVAMFRMQFDYHNAKTLLKAEAMNTHRSDLLSSCGRISPEKLEACIHDDSYTDCPEILGKAIAEAKSVLMRTENPQNADFVLDRAYFAELLNAAKELQSEYLVGYVRIMTDAANLRSAVRTRRMGKDADFLSKALIPGGEVDCDRIIAAYGSTESLTALYAAGPLAHAAALGAAASEGGRLTDFELAADNAVTEYLKKAKLVSFGEAPVAAYIAAVNTEQCAVRMILTGMLSGVGSDIIRERLRELYA